MLGCRTIRSDRSVFDIEDANLKYQLYEPFDILKMIRFPHWFQAKQNTDQHFPQNSTINSKLAGFVFAIHPPPPCSSCKFRKKQVKAGSDNERQHTTIAVFSKIKWILDTDGYPHHFWNGYVKLHHNNWNNFQWNWNTGDVRTSHLHWVNINIKPSILFKLEKNWSNKKVFHINTMDNWDEPPLPVHIFILLQIIGTNRECDTYLII